MFATLQARFYRFFSPVLTLVLLPVFAAVELGLLLSKRVPPFQPRGKVILITGASSGIGADLALRYAQGGAKLILCARRKKELEEVSQKCLKAGAQNVWIESVDITHETAFKNIIERHGNANGCLDMIVLNAGIGMAQLVRNLPDTSMLRKVIDLNYTACASGVIYALPFLKAASRGKVVFINSGSGFFCMPAASGYNASKFALKAFADVLRMEEPTLDVTTICPGPVATDIFEKSEGGAIDLKKMSVTPLPLSDCTDLIVDAVNRGARDEAFGLDLNLAWFANRWFPRIFDALVTDMVKAVVEDKAKEGKVKAL